MYLRERAVWVRWIEVWKTSKLPARTCKKLPVASFCASETAETGRIANGCEQGDHVSRRKGAIARAACRPDRGKLSAYQKVPKGKRIVTFCGVQKVTQKAHGTPSCDLGSKLYRLYFFVTFPALVPTPAYGATRFFGCFEPVRKGCCSTDARLILFENGSLYCKLTRANVFEKGGCSLSLLLWEFVFTVCWLNILEVNQGF